MKKTIACLSLGVLSSFISIQSSFADAIAEGVCHTYSASDYPNTFKDCESLTQSNTYFDPQGVAACRDNLISSSPMDRNSCLTTIAGQRFQPGAVQNCILVMQFDYSGAGFACLQNIANKVYGGSELADCRLNTNTTMFQDLLQHSVDCMSSKGQYQAPPAPTPGTGGNNVIIINNNNTVVTH